MFFVFSGPIGQDFIISDKQKLKLKEEIIKLLADRYDGDRCRFQIKADDCLGLIAVEACLEFIDKYSVEEYKFMFICPYTDDFSLLPENVQAYYKEIIADLKEKNQRCAVDSTIGLIERSNTRDRKIQQYDNYHIIMYPSDADFYITYYDKNSCKDKDFLKDIRNHWFKTEKCFNFHPIINKIYDAPKMKGVRKRASSSKYYYRIKCKLPDGTPVNIEKGSFLTVELAAKARREHLIALTTQECEDSNRTVDDVFQEFIDTTCHDKPSLKKKYISCYNSRFKTVLGKLHISNTAKTLKALFNELYNHKLVDKRGNDNKILFSLTYVKSLKAMMFNFFDYAYNQKLISSHPMYQISDIEIWAERGHHTKQVNNNIEPLFAYSGNKYRLLPNLKLLFPTEIGCFVDLFGGSSVVGINADAKQIIVNDNNEFLQGILRGLQSTKPEAAWSWVEQIITEYRLNNENEEEYYACRDAYNNIPYTERCEKFWYWGLVLVWCSFNRSTVQFNQQNEYNAPFGFNKVNFDLAKRKFFTFANKISEINVTFSCEDYKQVNIPSDAFVYLAPPYLITTASYNKTWDEQSEQDLYLYLEKLDADGIKWAMSNALKNNGAVHPLLLDWVNEKRYKIHYLNADYSHANFRRKNKGKTVEVLVTNY